MKKSHWNNHYHTVENKHNFPATTLSKALQFKHQDRGRSKEIQAVDLGCGNGMDTIAMLEEGYHVLATDKEQGALQRISKIIAPKYPNKLNVLLSRFEDLEQLPPSDLINASFCLPFCPPEHFGPFWSLITGSILPGGFFSGHFFGPKDSWSANTQMTFHSKQAVKGLFKDFCFNYFEETSKNGKTVSGKEKFWHVFHIVAKKQ